MASTASNEIPQVNSTALEVQLSEAQQHYQSGNLVEAEAVYRQIIQQDPRQVEALFWLALLADQAGRSQDSINCYEQVLTLQPNSAETHGNLGSVLLKLDRVEEAIAHHRQALALIPNNAKAHYNLAIALYEQKQDQEAIVLYQQAIVLQPDYANAHHNLGMTLHRQAKPEEAIACYRQAVQLEPNHASAHNSLAVALYQQNKLDEAIEHYQQAIAIYPGYVNAHDNLGIALKQQGKLEDAAIHFQQAIAFNPSYANAYINLGNAMRELGRFNEAIAYCEESIRLQPTNADARNTYGCVLVDLARFVDAIACFEDAVRLRPDFADAHLNMGIILLQIGEFRRGFEEYHWRWKTKQCPDLRYTQALWTGENLNGKVILLTAEQGFGDTIQFARYAPMVAARGGEVIIACQKPLLRLVATVPGVSRCVDRDKDNIDIHTHAPLLELPYILGTTTDTIPATVPYLSPSDQSVIRLEVPPDTRLKIGIVWATNPSNSTSSKRSCSLSHFISLLKVPGIALYSLQKEQPPTDLALLHTPRLQDLQDQLTDFADTAAAIAQLDLVITVDTAVAHLAGALGKPTWTLLPHIADWRWLTDRDDNPWYPTMRLFRQNQPATWDELFTRVAAALDQELTQPSPLQQSSTPPAPIVLPQTPHPEPRSHSVSLASASHRVGVTPNPEPRTPSSPILSLTGFNRIKQCRHGMMLFNVSDLGVGRSLDLYGEWNEGAVNLFQSLVHLGNTVVEVGTDIGAHTIFFAKTVGLQGKVIAIEPERMPFQMLCANLALNSITNTYSHPIALGETAGSLPLTAISKQPSSQTVLVTNSAPKEQVQIATLDSFGITQCRLLKLDVAGMTLPVLKGATQTLQCCQPALYLVGLIDVAVTHYLRTLGYDLYWHRPLLYNPNNFIQNSRNVFDNKAQANMLGFHRSQNITVNGLEPV
ncbi:FkbM family methyltransferase [Phormidium sp. CLA17]|uniref:FkbM family methyltransferase n=1 Tax=Leptolyngbya sp. Cla-17 TaxID=2803751 RepID=UPI0014910987|nr:FkbM family methyltransferase [Leptolyngbya sp. Cla-17]MBM0743085.1 FkbM family methyltransferase [Leptolyngbya sp. Cla-17]